MTDDSFILAVRNELKIRISFKILFLKKMEQYGDQTKPQSNVKLV